MQLNQSEETYKKWLGINQQSAEGPLTMTQDSFKEELEISIHGKVLLAITRQDFENLTVNELIEMMGVETR